MRPGVEQLEPRSMPARHLVILDWTPEFPSPVLASLRSPFDLDRDGDVTGHDTAMAGRAMTRRVRFLLRGTNTDVLGGDFSSGALITEDDDTLTQVVAVGGRFVPGLLGLAPRALRGVNYEGTCNVFSDEIARSYPHPWQWLTTVAAACVHEVGHMMGCRHPTGNVDGDLMNAWASPEPWNRRLTTAERTEIATWQRIVTIH